MNIQSISAARVALLSAAFLAISTAPTFAHVGHLADLAGHSHWIAAVSGIIAVAVVGVVTTAKSEDENTASDEEASADDADLADA